MRRQRILYSLLAALAAGTGAALVYFGAYNVAATDQHTAPVYWLLNTALKRAATQRAPARTPSHLDTAESAARGLPLYRQHCVSCHGAPGVAPDAFALGMTPLPANLALTAKHWTPGELYWVIRHGIKMTGMPAWGFRLRDEDLWDIVAFLRRLPALSPQAYAAETQLDDTRQAPADAVAAQPFVAAQADPKRGRQALQQYACVSCHEIPRVVGAIHPVGPPLAGMAHRGFIGGVLPNTRENMVRWLRNPQAIDPRTAMPDLGVSEADAHHIAAYLETLR